MSDHGDDDGHGTDESEGIERVTAPMQEFGGGAVTVGLVVLLVGLAVTMAVPLVLT
jgi:hypothetical protein